jgi:hypothetical protein
MFTAAALANLPQPPLPAVSNSLKPAQKCHPDIANKVLDFVTNVN